jgi:hypothetical protein
MGPASDVEASVPESIALSIAPASLDGSAELHAMKSIIALIAIRARI